jgi:hypothetical protein
MTCYILFSIDYGFQFHLFGTMNIYKIPIIFKFMPSAIIKVGLDILPAVKTLNYSNFLNTPQYYHEWTALALASFRRCMEKSIIVSFEPTMPEIQHPKNIVFGKIIVIKESNGKAVNVANRMINAEYAMQPHNDADFWTNYIKTNSANVQYLDNQFDGQPGIYELPNFESLFRKLAKTLNAVREKKINKEWTEEEKQNTQKVLSWLMKSEGHEGEIPSDDDLNKEEELFEFYVEVDEKSKKFPEIPHRVIEIPQKFNNVEIVQKPLIKRVFKHSTTFMPGGFQIATHVQNMPRFVTEGRDPKNVIEEEVPFENDAQEACGGDLEWPDSD